MFNSVAAYIMAALTAVLLAATALVLVNSAEDAAPTGSSAVRVDASKTTAKPATTSTSTSTTIPAPVPVPIPDLGGMNRGDAAKALRDVGLEFEAVDADAPAALYIGMVIGQEPSTGTELLPGESVLITIARRPKAVLVDRESSIPWEQAPSVDRVSGETGRCSIGRLQHDGMILDRVDCADPHDFQLFAEMRLDNPSYEGLGSLSVVVRGTCEDEFLRFVGASHIASTLSIYTLAPTADSWSSGSRTGTCLIGPHDVGQQIVGDAAGSLW